MTILLSVLQLTCIQRLDNICRGNNNTKFICQLPWNFIAMLPQKVLVGVPLIGP